MKVNSLAAALGAAALIAGCGSSGPTGSNGPSASSSPGGSGSAAGANPASIQDTQPAQAYNGLSLATSSDTQQISQTIKAFYSATWKNQGSQACALFSPAGAAGFLQAAKIAFPDSVNPTTSCSQAMAFFNADLADSADTLQQSGVNVSGNVLDNVGVSKIRIRGDEASAEAPDGVEEFVKPKTFLLVREHNRWLIDGSRKIGQTLPQLLAAAKRKHELVPKTTHSR
jgi:hypothetical protein